VLLLLLRERFKSFVEPYDAVTPKSKEKFTMRSVDYLALLRRL
jgi:hypothetical protein